MARSPFVPMDAREEAAGAGGGGAAAAAGKKGGQAPQGREQEDEAAVLVHSQVRRIKREDEEIRERLLKLRLLETRPAAGAGFVSDPVAWRASRSLSPLRRAGNGIPVGE